MYTAVVFVLTVHVSVDLIRKKNQFRTHIRIIILMTKSFNDFNVFALGLFAVSFEFFIEQLSRFLWS